MINESWKKILTVEKKEVDYPNSSETLYTFDSYRYSAELTVFYNIVGYPCYMSFEINSYKLSEFDFQITQRRVSGSFGVEEIIKHIFCWILLLEYIEVNHV